MLTFDINTKKGGNNYTRLAGIVCMRLVTFSLIFFCRHRPRRRSKFPLFQATTTLKLTQGAVVQNHTKEAHGLLGSWEALRVQFHGIMT